jgi:hypothetical protein
MTLAQIETLPAGTVLTVERRACDSLYFVLDGCARMKLNGEHVAMIEPGGFCNTLAYQRGEEGAPDPAGGGHVLGAGEGWGWEVRGRRGAGTPIRRQAFICPDTPVPSTFRPPRRALIRHHHDADDRARGAVAAERPAQAGGGRHGEAREVGSEREERGTGTGEGGTGQAVCADPSEQRVGRRVCGMRCATVTRAAGKAMRACPLHRVRAGCPHHSCPAPSLAARGGVRWWTLPALTLPFSINTL